MNSDNTNAKWLFMCVSFFAIGIMVTSLMQMTGLLSFERYLLLFDFLPREVVLVRYCLSWTLRFVSIICAIGLLVRNNICRKILLGVFVFTLCTVYWKHPYAGFVNHTRMLDERWASLLAMLGEPRLSFSMIAVPAMVGAIVLDVLFAAVFIYYFTRPGVRKLFE